MSNVTDHARRELAIMGIAPTPKLSRWDRLLIWCRLKKKPGFDYDGAIGASVIEVVELFASHGHSGYSASWAIQIIEKVLRREPVRPLTGGDDEWNDISEMSGEPCWQNRRCSRVFKGADGQAYDVKGKVFVEPSGAAFTSRDSRAPVTFPYTPKTEYVKVPLRGPDGRFQKVLAH